MRRFCSIVFLCAVYGSLFALPVDYRLSFRGGAIMPDSKVDVVAGHKGQWTGPVWNAEFAVAFHPDWQGLRDWNDASVGVALGYWYLGDPSKLGSAITPYLFLDVPLIRCPHFVWGLRPGVGVAFLTRTYRNTISSDLRYTTLADANSCIGSVFNFHFPEAMYFEFPIRDGWSVLAAGGWYHISNGSMVQPNSGYNIFSGEVGVRYQPRSAEPTPKELPSSAAPLRKWEVEFAFAAGGRQVYYQDRQTFFACELQAAAYWRAHRIFRLGGGVDVFYDGAYHPRQTNFQKTYLAAARSDGSDCWRLGVSLQPEFVVGHFTAGFHFGVYLLDPVKNLEPYSDAVQSESGRLNKGIFYRYNLLKAGSAGYPDGWLYTQIVLRYRLPYHLFVQATMKAHLTKVEFVSAGVGVYL